MTSTVEGASLNMNELSLSLYSQAEAHEQAGSDQMQTPDFLVLARQLSGDMILCATEAQILLLLPSILHRIEVCKVPHEKRGAMDALRIRLCSSRRLKLRFLLLRKHDAFRTLSSRLRYSSRAYDVPIVTTACSSSHIDIEDDMTAMPQSICVPVDMVDLQSEDFYRNVIFSSKQIISHRIGQQVISHVFRPMGTGHSRDDVLHMGNETTDGRDEDELGQFGYIDYEEREPILDIRRLKIGSDEVVSENLETMQPRMRVRSGRDMLTLQVMMVTFEVFNEIWRRAWGFGDSLSAPQCVTMDCVAVAQTRGVQEYMCHEQSALLLDFVQWQARHGHRAVMVDRLVRTAAGALTAGYVLGLQMRSGRELCVKDDAVVFWGDGGTLFESAGQPGNGGRVLVPHGLRKCLKALKVWDTFRKHCATAFQGLRQNWDEVYEIVGPLLVRCGYSDARMTEFTNSRWSVNLRHKDGYRGEMHFRRWLG